MAPRLLDRKTAAAYCGVSANTFSSYVEPHLAAFEIGARRLFDVRAIDHWIDGQGSRLYRATSDEEWLERG